MLALISADQAFSFLPSHGSGRLPRSQPISQCCPCSRRHPGHALLPEGAQGKERFSRLLSPLEMPGQCIVKH